MFEIVVGNVMEVIAVPWNAAPSAEIEFMPPHD